MAELSRSGRFDCLNDAGEGVSNRPERDESAMGTNQPWNTSGS